MQLSFPARAPAITVTSPNASEDRRPRSYWSSRAAIRPPARRPSSPRANGTRRDSRAAPFRHERRAARSENQETAQPAGSAGELVMRSRIELEVEFNRHGATPGLDRYHLHTKCFAAWELERKKSGAD